MKIIAFRSVVALLFISLVTVLRAADGAWISLAPMPEPRQEVGVAEVNGKIYAVGGLPRTNRVQEYDAANNSWRIVAPLPIPGGVDHTATAAVGGRLYVIGGNTNSGSTNAVFEYDPARDQWTQKASMPTARNALAGAVIEGKIYVVGGAGATERELEVYDPATDTWAQRAPMAAGRNHLAAGAIRGKLYVAGGRIGGNLLLSILEVYDPATNTWATRAPMPTGRSGHAGAVLRDKLFTFGGEGNPNSPVGIFGETEVYDPDTDTWKSLDPMPTPRHGVGAATVGNRIYVPGGATQQGGGTHVGANEAFVAQSDKLVFAHLVAGRGIDSELLLANSAEGQTAVATVELRDQNGRPLEVNLDGSVRSKATATVPAAGSITVRATDSGSVLRTGWITVSSDIPLSGLIFIADSVSGLNSSLALTRFFFPVQRDPSAGVSCSAAFANTTDGPVTISLILRTANGAELSRRQVTLPPGAQIAELLERIFPDASFTGAGFRGTVSATSTGPVAAVALLFKGNNFTALPVTGFQ